MYTIDEGFCFELHRKKALHVECLGSFANLIKGFICIVMAIYILRKMFKNQRRALAGYTKNTVRN